MLDKERGYLTVKVVPDGTRVDIGTDVITMDNPDIYLCGRKTNVVLLNQTAINRMYRLRDTGTVH